MVLTDARRSTRTDSRGALIPLAEQDRSRWDQAGIAECVALITDALSRSPLGAYQLQAAIAAVHAEASCSDETDWPQILALYDLLERMAPNPMVTLNRAVAVGMVHGPQAALPIVAALETDERIAGHHRLDAVRAHLLELAGDRPGATASYLAAARRTTSIPEQRYLEARAARLDPAR
jgi:predicted RNA polymerase sigma factor